MDNYVGIEEQQKILCEGLLYFKHYCDKNGLSFYICNGTLLGATKYNGIIPWDDDIDVMMPRKDYDKLVNATDINSSQFKLMSKEQDCRWRMPYAKLTHTGTIVKEGSCDFGLPIGLSIDVFPIDNWDNRKWFAFIQAHYCSLLRRLLSNSISEEFETERKGIKKLILLLIWIVSHVLGFERVEKKLEGQAKRNADTIEPAYKGSVSWAPYGVKEIIPVSWLDSIVFLTFEGEQYPTFSGYKNYLSNLYGDYEKDPPKEKQKSNHKLLVWKNED